MNQNATGNTASTAPRGRSTRPLWIARAKAAMQANQANSEPGIATLTGAVEQALQASEVLPSAQFTVYSRPLDVGGFGFRRGGVPQAPGFEALATVEAGTVTWRKEARS